MLLFEKKIEKINENFEMNVVKFNATHIKF